MTIRKDISLAAAVGKKFTGWVVSRDLGRVALLFDDDGCLELYASYDNNVESQHVFWEEYPVDAAIRSGLVDADTAKAHAENARAEREARERRQYEHLKALYEAKP